MKDKFLLPSVLAGLLQAILLFLCMDLFYYQTVTENSALSHLLYSAGPWLIPSILGTLFGCAYAAPMLLFSRKRNWLFYFLCTLGFFLLFSLFFLSVVYALPEHVAHIDVDLGDLVPEQWEGLLFGLVLMVISFPYFLCTALAKLAVHLTFLIIHWVKVAQQRKRASV